VLSPGLEGHAPALAYLESVVAVCDEVLGKSLRSAWIVGSLATGDFDLRRSDVDVLVACADPLDSEQQHSLGRLLRHGALPCPARGLDLLVYSLAELKELRRSPRFEFSISSGADWGDEIASGGPYPGGLVDLAVARSAGIPIVGPRAEDMVGRCPGEWLMEELTEGVRWHTTRVHDAFHDPTGSNAVLNACRAFCFAAMGVLISKTAGARWLLERDAAPVVAEALAEREAGGGIDRLDRTDVLTFLDAVLQDLDADTV
jgi:hypothetical protein